MVKLTSEVGALAGIQRQKKQSLDNQRAAAEIISMEIENDLSRYKSKEYKKPEFEESREQIAVGVGKEAEAKGYRASLDMDQADLERAMVTYQTALASGNEDTFQKTKEHLQERWPALGVALDDVDFSTDKGKARARSIAEGMARSLEIMQKGQLLGLEEGVRKRLATHQAGLDRETQKERFGHEVDILDRQLDVQVYQGRLNRASRERINRANNLFLNAIHKAGLYGTQEGRDLFEAFARSMITKNMATGSGPSRGLKPKDYEEALTDMSQGFVQTATEKFGVPIMTRQGGGKVAPKVPGTDAMSRIAGELMRHKQKMDAKGEETKSFAEIQDIVENRFVIWDKDIGYVPLLTYPNSSRLVGGIGSEEILTKAREFDGDLEKALEWYSEQMSEEGYKWDYHDFGPGWMEQAGTIAADILY